jgi:ribosomal protein S18 acetylase RimI-like enzyme
VAKRIIGVSCYGHSRVKELPDDGELVSLYVLPKFMGAGYGHPLLAYMEAALAQDGYANLVLDVFTDNTRAIRFYAGHGWRKVTVGELSITINALKSAAQHIRT